MTDGSWRAPVHRAWTPLIVLLALVAILPVLLALLYFNVAGRVFQLLGLSPVGAIALVCASLIGSLINIPLTRREFVAPNPALGAVPEWLRGIAPMFFYYPPVVVRQALALNVGGAIIPVAFSVYLLTLPSTPLLPTLVATLIVMVVVRLLARPLPGRGIALPAFVPLIVTALAAHFLTLGFGEPLASAAPVAYISGTLGVLIGADILNLPRVWRGSLIGASVQPIPHESLDAADDALNAGEAVGRQCVVSIGGAGMFDGIFLTSVLAPLLAVL